MRREIPGRKDQPAEKRRKVDNEKYIRVIVDEKNNEKRKDMENEKIHPMFKRKKFEKKITEEKTEETEKQK